MEREAAQGEGQPEPSQRESGVEALQVTDAVQNSFVTPEHHESNEHIALIYETRDEQFATAVPFIHQGLEQGEKCLYVVDDNSKEEVIAAMRADDIDVEAAQESGALTFFTEETYISNGSFTPDEQLAFLADAIESATEAYPAARVAVEMTCFLDADLEYSDLIAYEERYNTISEEADAIALCQYNRNRFPDDVIRDTIRAHPHLIADGTLGHNVHYIPPAEFFDSERSTHDVERMMATTAELAKAETELKRQNDRLEQFASIVSHDLRNPLQTAEGHLQLAQENYEGDHLDAVATALERMYALIDDLLSLARATDEAADFESVDLAELTTNCWENVPTAAATLVVDADSTVRAAPGQLQQLLENLIRNAVEHGGGEVTITIGDLDGAPGFYLADDGRGIPADKHGRVFDSGYTTDDGGTGFGLSIAKEIADAHEWALSVTDAADGGARFEVTGVETVS